MTQKLSFIWIFISIAFCLSAIVLQRHPAAIYKKNASADSMYYLPGAGWLQVFSSGYNEATADLIWTQFVVYFSTAPMHKVKKGEFVDKAFLKRQKRLKKLKNYSLNYINAVTHLDPYFLGAYTHGARLAMYHEGVLSRNTIETAIAILEKGLTHYPNNGQLLFNLGFLYYYELVPFIENDKEVEKYQQMGAQYIQKSSTAPNAPPYCAELANQLLTRHDMNDLMAEHLKQQFLTETNPDVREGIMVSLQKALDKQHESDLIRLDALHTNWKQQHSYIPIELYAILTQDPQTIDSILAD